MIYFCNFGQSFFKQWKGVTFRLVHWNIQNFVRWCRNGGSNLHALFVILGLILSMYCNHIIRNQRQNTAVLLCLLQLPGHLQVRLQAVQNWHPPPPSTEQTCINSNILLTWLKRIQFKLGQIEVQSSAATQFYSVWTIRELLKVYTL